MSTETNPSVPSGWIAASLDDLCLVVQGQSPPGETYNTDRQGLPFFQGKAEFGELHPTAVKWCSKPGKVAEPGDILISIRAPVGPTNVCLQRSCIGRGLAAIRPLPGIRREYVLYALRSSEATLAALGTGSTFGAIGRKVLKAHRLLLAPAAEQGRIVSQIESCLTRLDSAVAALRRVQANLKRYRASVLKAACEGRLVPTEAELARAEGRGYESADKLLDRILVKRRARWEADQLARMQAAGRVPKDNKWKTKYREPRGPETANLPKLPEGWTWARWGQIGFSQNGRAFPSGEYQPTGVKLLRPGNLHSSGRVVWTGVNTRHLPDRWMEECRDLLVGPRELVMNLTAQSLRDEFLGRVCMTGDRERCLLNQRLARLTPVATEPRYLLWMFKSQTFRRFVDGLNTGSLIQHMFTSQLEGFALPLPPVGEQQRIAIEVERQLSVLEELEQVVDANLKRADRLRQAILRRAFEGKLVPQDPREESASVLLERIRLEREARGRPSGGGNEAARARSRRGRIGVQRIGRDGEGGRRVARASNRRASQ